MGNIIYSQDFKMVLAAQLSARTTETGYDVINIMDRTEMRRRYRAADFTVNDWLIKAQFSPTVPIYGVLISNINSSKVKLQGNATDSWGAPTYAGTDLAVSLNPWTKRGSIFIDFGGTPLNYEYWRLFTPATATGIGNIYTTKLEIGTVCFLTSRNELAHNMSYGYEETADQLYKDSMNECVATGEFLRWRGSLNFGNRAIFHAAELKTFNQMRMDLPFVFYLNNGNTSEAYICKREDPLQLNWFTFGGVSGNKIALREWYMIGEK